MTDKLNSSWGVVPQSELPCTANVEHRAVPGQDVTIVLPSISVNGAGVIVLSPARTMYPLYLSVWGAKEPFVSKLIVSFFWGSSLNNLY